MVLRIGEARHGCCTVCGRQTTVSAGLQLSYDTGEIVCYQCVAEQAPKLAAVYSAARDLGLLARPETAVSEPEGEIAELSGVLLRYRRQAVEGKSMLAEYAPW
jgi:hypothetical protein